MNDALTLRPPAPLRLGLLLKLAVAVGLASAVSLAPMLGRTTTVTAAASSTTHSAVCHCAHCPGGRACCCHAASCATH